MSKKRIILAIIIGIVFVGVIVLAIIVATRSKSSTTSKVQPQTATLHTNQDTGEQTVTDPALGGSESQDASSFIVYGLADFIDKSSIDQSQIDFIKDQLSAYSTQNLGSKYTNVTIRPQDTTIDFTNDTATSTLRLADSNNIVAIRINGIATGVMQLFITDTTGKNGGNFTSPVVTLVGA